MKNKKDPKAIEEKDFLKSLDALEDLAKGAIGETPDLEIPDTIEEIDAELEKSLEGKTVEPDVFTADDLEKAAPDSDDEDEDEDDDTEKSFAGMAAEGSENIEKAIEVSDFLADLVDQVGFAIDGIRADVAARMDTVEKSLAGVAAFNDGLAKSLKTSFTEMDNGLDTLKKSVDGMADAPIHSRKSVTTLNKSFAGASDEDGNKAIGRKDIISALDTALEKSVEGVAPMDIVRFETTGTLSKSAATAIGMEGLVAE